MLINYLYKLYRIPIIVVAIVLVVSISIFIFIKCFVKKNSKINVSTNNVNTSPNSSIQPNVVDRWKTSEINTPTNVYTTNTYNASSDYPPPYTPSTTNNPPPPKLPSLNTNKQMLPPLSLASTSANNYPVGSLNVPTSLTTQDPVIHMDNYGDTPMPVIAGNAIPLDK